MEKKAAAFQNKGMSRDLSISKAGNDLAFENYNIRITARDKNTLFSVTNEKGNANVQLLRKVAETVVFTCYAGGNWRLSKSLDTDLPVIFESTDGSKETTLIKAGNYEGNNFVTSGNPANIYIEPSEDFNFLAVYTDSEDQRHEYLTGHRQTIMNLTGTLLGHAVLNSFLILFTHTDSGASPDHIYRIEVSQGLAWECAEIFSGNLNFDVEHPIEALPLYELEDVQKVYWVDGKNQPRVINIMRNYTGSSPSILDFTPAAEMLQEEDVDIKKVFSVVGTFPSGVIQYIIYYYNENLQSTNPVYISPQFYISPYNRGAAADETVSCAFTGTLKNLSTDFDYIRVVAAVRTSLNGALSYYLVGDYRIAEETSGGTVSFTDTGNYQAAMDIAGLSSLYKSDLSAYTLSSKDNTLFIGNIVDNRGRADITLRENCLNLIDKGSDNSESISTVIDFELSSGEDNIPYGQAVGEYPYSSTLSYPENRVTSFKGGEKYRFALQFISDKGIRSQAFWIGDKTNPVYPEMYYDSRSYEFSIRRPLAKCTVPAGILETAYANGYRYVQLFRSEASYYDRGILAQGVCSPTVFNLQDRYNNSPFAQSSWFFRPKNSRIQASHMSSVNASSSSWAIDSLCPAFDEVQVIKGESSPSYVPSLSAERTVNLMVFPITCSRRSLDMSSRAGYSVLYRCVRYNSAGEIYAVGWNNFNKEWVWKINGEEETYYRTTTDNPDDPGRSTDVEINVEVLDSIVSFTVEAKDIFTALEDNYDGGTKNSVFNRNIYLGTANVPANINYWIAQYASYDGTRRSAWKAYSKYFIYYCTREIGTDAADSFNFKDWGNQPNGDTAESVMKNSEGGMLIWHPGYALESIQKPAVIEFVGENSAGYFIDESICTFHSPEQEFLIGTDISKSNIQFVGIAPITAISTQYSLDFANSETVEAPAKVFWATAVSNDVDSINTAIKALEDDSSTDDFIDVSGMIAAPQFWSAADAYPVIYPWSKEGKVGIKETSAEVTKHYTCNRRFSFFSKYFPQSGESIWRTIQTQIQNFRWITQSDNFLYSLLEYNNQRTYNPGSEVSVLPSDTGDRNYPIRVLTDEYIAGGDIDMMRTRGLGVMRTDNNVDYTSSPVMMTYRSPSHGVFVLGNSVATGNRAILPVLHRNEFVLGTSGDFPWDIDLSSGDYKPLYSPEGFNTLSRYFSDVVTASDDDPWGEVSSDAETAISQFFGAFAENEVYWNDLIDYGNSVEGVVRDQAIVGTALMSPVRETVNSWIMLGRYGDDGSEAGYKINRLAAFLLYQNSHQEYRIPFGENGDLYRNLSMVYTPTDADFVIFPINLIDGATFEASADTRNTSLLIQSKIIGLIAYDQTEMRDGSYYKVYFKMADSPSAEWQELSLQTNSASGTYATFKYSVPFGPPFTQIEPRVGKILITLGGLPFAKFLVSYVENSETPTIENLIKWPAFMYTVNQGKGINAYTEYKYSTDSGDVQIEWNSDIENWTAISTNVEQESFRHYDSYTEEEFGAQNFGYPYLVIGELYNEYEDSYDPRYGGTTQSAASGNTFVPCSSLIKIPEPNGGGFISPVVLTGNRGDTFIRRYDCLKTLPLNEGSKNNVVEIASVLLESHVNMDGRSDKNIGISNLESFTEENINLVNPVYSNTQGIQTASYLISSYDVFSYPNEILWSQPKTFGEMIDSWTSISQVDYLLLDGNLGNVRKLARLNNSIICFQDKGIAEILYNTRTQMSTTTGVPVELMNSGKVDGKRYITDKAGCTNKWSIVETKRGIYFIDNLTSSISVFNGAVESLSDVKGFKEWIGSNNSMNIWNPSKFDNFISFWDRINDDVYFINKDCCLVYNEQLEQFTSFMDYQDVPMMVNVNDRFISYKNENLWAQGEGDYNMFFGNAEPYYVEYRIAPDPYNDKTFTNLEYRADILDSDGRLTGDTFDHIVVSDEYQSNSVDVEYSPHEPSDLKKKFRIWRVNIPRSAISQDNPYGLDRMRNPWIKVKLKKNDNLDRNEIMEFHDLLVKYYE